MNKKIEENISFVEDVGMIITWLVVSIYIIYLFGGSVLFYFEQSETTAHVTSINKKIAEVTYFNEFLEREIKFTYSFRGNLKKYKKMRSSSTWNIIYSQRDPYQVSFKGIDPRPSLMGLFIIIISLIPVISFKSFRLEKK
mgnify:CR=1 FL=1|jgi:hypothetical protein